MDWFAAMERKSLNDILFEEYDLVRIHRALPRLDHRILYGKEQVQ